MSARRLVPLVLGVVGLLAVAALASHGRPLTGSGGSGPTVHFFDYVFTSLVIVAVGIAVLFVIGVLGTKPANPGRPRPRFRPLQLLLSFIASALFGFLLFHARFHQVPKPKTPGGPPTRASGRGADALPPGTHPRSARLRWDEVAIVAALLAGVGVAAFGSRSKKPLKDWRFGSHEDVALALDESLDDLRLEPDLRRAIIAAYARMERAFAAAGMPRRAAEGPREYLARTLGALDTSSESVTRLTDLFEWAKFSQHDPEPAMRDEAIEALTAVREELRRPAEEAA